MIIRHIENIKDTNLEFHKDERGTIVDLFFNENIKIFNFGFNGYGPHQFLSYLDHFENLSFFKCKKNNFYLFLYK